MKYVYFSDNNTVEGPFSLDEITELLSTGAISMQTQVSKEDQTNWQPLDAIIEPRRDLQQAPKTVRLPWLDRTFGWLGRVWHQPILGSNKVWSIPEARPYAGSTIVKVLRGIGWLGFVACGFVLFIVVADIAMGGQQEKETTRNAEWIFLGTGILSGILLFALAQLILSAEECAWRLRNIEALISKERQDKSTS